MWNSVSNDLIQASIEHRTHVTSERMIQTVAQSVGTRLAVIRHDYPETKIASFTKLLCSKPDGSSLHKSTNGSVLAGIAVYLSRHTPLAIWGPGARTTLSSGGGFDAGPSVEITYTPPKTGEWALETRIVEDALKAAGYSLPSHKALAKPLAKPLPFQSAMCMGKAKVFDALFHLVY